MTCDMCKFFKLFAKDICTDGRGECRRFPPVLYSGDKWRTPSVTPIHWCGEFKPAKKIPTKP